MTRLHRLLAALAATLALVVPTAARADEAATAALFDRLLPQPARLRVFLQAMPKGGDLHNHLWGQPYAEQLLDWAGEAGLCVSRSQQSIVPGPCTGADLVSPVGLGRVDETLYGAMIEAFSTRGRIHGLGVNDTTGHDDFFDSFGRFFLAAVASPGPMAASARTSAAANGLSYLELIQNPAAIDQAGALAHGKPWKNDEFAAALRQIQPALPTLLADAIAETDRMEADARRRLDCGKRAAGACDVVVRYQAYGLRSQPPAFVFGQLALAFLLAEKDARYVAVNIVAPEDGPVAVADFDLHMRMFRFFAERHPTVKLSLHAGELDLGIVPPHALRHHIRDTIEIAGADRIGHGIDISYEADAPALLARMAKERIAVEINLTSNDIILGVRGARHPLALYRAAGVAFVLSTDDEGVSRSDMTNEYLRAATEQGLRYADLKAAARASLEYAFLPGASLWRGGAIGDRAEACRDAVPGGATPGGACGLLLTDSDKARAQWRLEGELAAFEARVVTLQF